MLKRIFSLAAICMMGLSSLAQSATVNDQYVDYQLDNDRYSVVYIQSEGMSEKEVKELAMKRAAEITKSNGYRYFQVESTQKVEVASTTPHSNPFGGNIYEEKRIQGDSGTTSIEQRTEPTPGGIYPGYKITFRTFKEKPSSSSYDACEYVGC